MSTLNEKIQQIVKKNHTPDQSLLPTVWVEWHTKYYDNYYKNLKTGETERGFFDKQEQDDLVCTRGGKKTVLYIKYHEEHGLLELACVSIDRVSSRGAQQWYFDTDYLRGERFFIDKNRSVYNADGQQRDGNIPPAMFRVHVGKKCLEEFKSFLGCSYITVGNGRAMKVYGTYGVRLWIEQPACKRKNGKTQSKIDMLIKTHHLLSLNHEDVSVRVGADSIETKLELLDDKWCVLRYLQTIGGHRTESFRLYVAEDGDYVLAKRNLNGEWVPSAAPPASYWSVGMKVPEEHELMKNKRLSYFAPIMKHFDEQFYLYAIAMMLRHPEIEQIMKLGYVEVGKKIIRKMGFNNFVKMYFGEINKKGKNIYAKFGLSKQNFDTYLESIEDRGIYGGSGRIAFRVMKKAFGNLSAMDGTSFLKYYRCMTAVLDDLYLRHCIGNFIEGSPEAKNIIKGIEKVCRTNSMGVSIVRDTFSVWQTLSRPIDISFVFDDFSDLLRKHDLVVAAYNAEEERRECLSRLSRAERDKAEEASMREIDESRKQYEYEDENYLIRLPKSIDEIAQEGVSQHICIGSYAYSHADGSTNLFFLREKQNCENPFYAIEMNNQKNIVQIHGFGNKWLGCNPEAIPFVMRWLRDNKIHCDEKILTCKATGYGRINDYVELPTID